MVGEDTFYEKADERDSRYERLVRQVTGEDPEWVAAFLCWLRAEGNMRSAPLVGAAAFVAERLILDKPGMSRQVVDSVLQRPDEPGEFLALWAAQFGRMLPKPVKRGVADAVARLYTQRSLLKYDTDSHGYRFGDVIERVHPSPDPDKAWQGELFRYALDRRHGRDNEVPEALQMVRLNGALRRSVAGNDVEPLLVPEMLAKAGMTWEDVLSLAGSRVDKAKLWEAIIGSMGYMALLRNLRNFDEAGVSDAVAAIVGAKLADPAEVARSRQFPFRFLSAYRNVKSLRWSWPLEQGLGHSLANVPALKGRTLILVDQSPSMFPGAYYSTPNKSDVALADLAKTFGSALALRCDDATLVQYGSLSERVPFGKGESVLPLLAKFRMLDGTDTFGAAARWYGRHDRVVIVTDEQTTPGRDPIPVDVPVYVWNLSGYKYGQLPGARNRHTFGGLTDHAFKLIPLLEAGHNGAWPWLATA